LEGEKSLPPTGIRNPDHPARSLVATPTTIQRLAEGLKCLKNFKGKLEDKIPLWRPRWIYIGG
jgi:hypothetical protein